MGVWVEGMGVVGWDGRVWVGGKDGCEWLDGCVCVTPVEKICYEPVRAIRWWGLVGLVRELEQLEPVGPLKQLEREGADCTVQTGE